MRERSRQEHPRVFGTDIRSYRETESKQITDIQTHEMPEHTSAFYEETDYEDRRTVGRQMNN